MTDKRSQSRDIAQQRGSLGAVVHSESGHLGKPRVAQNTPQKKGKRIIMQLKGFIIPDLSNIYVHSTARTTTVNTDTVNSSNEQHLSTAPYARLEWPSSGPATSQTSTGR